LESFVVGEVAGTWGISGAWKGKAVFLLVIVDCVEENARLENNASIG